MPPRVWVSALLVAAVVAGVNIWALTGAPAPHPGGWPEWVTAVSTAVLALAGLGALVVAYKAGRVAIDGLHDARKTRHGQLALELTKRWDDPAMRKSITLFTEYRPQGIIDLHDSLFADPAKQWERAKLESTLANYNELLLWPNLIETIGVLWSEGAVDAEFVYKLWGPGILSAWKIWEKPVEHIRKTPADAAAYTNFEELAKALERLDA